MQKMTIDVVGRPFATRKSRAGTLLLAAFGLALLGLGLWVRGLPAFVAWQTARDHSHGLRGRTTSRVWSSEPAVVTAWLEEHGTPVPPLPDHAGSAGLVGAHYCSLVDRVAAHVVYQGEDASVSIFVLHGPVRAPSGWAASVRGIHVQFVRTAGRTLAIVGEREDDVRAALRGFATSLAGVVDPRLRQAKRSRGSSPRWRSGLTLAFARRSEAEALHLAGARG
jgi:hypothetical protein